MARSDLTPDEEAAQSDDGDGGYNATGPVSAARVEEVARAFHESYERQARDYDYVTRTASAVPWDDAPAQNKEFMRAVVLYLLARGVVR